ncbi:MAG: signal peptide peptidase SppA [Nanoarchaeota archaeon]
MKRGEDKRGERLEKPRWKTIVWTILAVLFVLFVLFPVIFSLVDGPQFGNVARIPIQGLITGDGQNYLSQETTSSQTIVQFIQDAERNPQIKGILIEINSPGGSAVASDEIATAIKRAEKPVIALIREVGASGGYWVASAADYIIANRMSITGSIGVLSSYLEFSGLMDKYGVNYERLVAGRYKDIGSPFTPLTDEKREILQGKLDQIHAFFIEEIAANRKLNQSRVRELATGEFFLGVEARELDLVDELGDLSTAEEYLKQTYGLMTVDYVVYEKKAGLLDLLSSVATDFSFSLGQGIGATFTKRNDRIMVGP